MFPYILHWFKKRINFRLHLSLNVNSSNQFHYTGINKNIKNLIEIKESFTSLIQQMPLAVNSSNSVGSSSSILFPNISFFVQLELAELYPMI